MKKPSGQQHNDSNTSPENYMERRTFVATLTKATGVAAVLSVPMISKAEYLFKESEARTVGDIMDLFIKEVPGAPFADTVDTLKAGSRDIEVTGIVTTMFATIEVIQKAIGAGANFIIAHEPTFYNHADDVSWLQEDEVYRYKADLLKQHNIAVWRNHDYIHSLAADGVRAGVLAQLAWSKYDSPAGSEIVNVPAVNLRALIKQLKEKMNIATLRYIGNLAQVCTKVLLMPGAVGGKRQIEGMHKEKPDVLICGEIQEWETAEYVRDARAKGDQLSLIILGHIASEEAGSEFMAAWLKERVPEISTIHIPAGASLSFM